MIEQSILLFLLIVALAATLGLFFLKSKRSTGTMSAGSGSN
jgi:hypothetical protein